nr:zinc-ribbon domain-containing protein [Escherichia coli]
MYAKSFIALDGNGRLTGARTAQAAPYAHYTCHLCGSALRYHPQYDTELPWFEHTDDRLTEHGWQRTSDGRPYCTGRTLCSLHLPLVWQCTQIPSAIRH